MTDGHSHGIYSDIITSRGQKDWRFSSGGMFVDTHSHTQIDIHVHFTILCSPAGGGRLQSNA